MFASEEIGKHNVIVKCEPYKDEVDDMARCFCSADTDHFLEPLVPKMPLQIQMV